MSKRLFVAVLSVLLLSGCGNYPGSSNDPRTAKTEEQRQLEAEKELAAIEAENEAILERQRKNPPTFGKKCDTPGQNDFLSPANTWQESIDLGEKHFALICDEIDGVWRDYEYRQAREEREEAEAAEALRPVDTNSREYITGLTIGNNFSDFSDAGAFAEDVCATARDRRIVLSSRGGVGVDPRTASFLSSKEGFQGCIDGFNGVPQD
jgi:hypothetical protein